MAKTKRAAKDREPMSDRKVAALAAEHAELDAERLGYDRLARARVESMEAIEKVLDEEMKLRGQSEIDTPKFSIRRVERDGAPFYKGELLKAIGKDAFDDLIASQPKREKVIVEPKLEVATKGRRRSA
jgi:hypothetical protein